MNVVNARLTLLYRNMFEIELYCKILTELCDWKLNNEIAFNYCYYEYDKTLLNGETYEFVVIRN